LKEVQKPALFSPAAWLDPGVRQDDGQRYVAAFYEVINHSVVLGCLWALFHFPMTA
jgi:hypothetical protein